MGGGGGGGEWGLGVEVGWRGGGKVSQKSLKWGPDVHTPTLMFA